MRSDKDGAREEFAARLYVAEVSGPDDMTDKWYKAMPARRREKCDRLKIEADRIRCICSYALLVHALKDLDRFSVPDTIEIIEDENGKPDIPGLPVSFSISHSGRMVAAALSPVEIGCDVEMTHNDPVKIAKRFFAKEENEFLGSLSGDELSETFTDIWTLKESVVKCSGEGIRHPFSDFSVVEGGCIASETKLPGDERTYHIKLYGRMNGHSFSACSLSGEMEDTVRYVNDHSYLM